MLTWLHVGDLHISHEDGYVGIERLRRIVGQANRYLQDAVDFVFLPGDNANNGTLDQYNRIGEVLNQLLLPVHAIPGDHDFEPGNLDAYHAMPGADRLPKRVDVKGRGCLFLDIVSAGAGGPDFRLGNKQLHWLECELAKPAPIDQRPVVFMHAYPGDMREEGGQLGQLFASARVAAVDTGHTHYNELLNDGAVIYASTRSTGQVEEGYGEAGFSLVAVDGAAVSWRFKPLASAWPFVLITSPADHRLVTAAASRDPASGESVVVRAKVFGHDIASVTVSIDSGEPLMMHAVDGEPSMWAGQITLPIEAESCGITVRARSADGSWDEDRIDVMGTGASLQQVPCVDPMPGTDAWAVKPWPEHGVLGSQLGPNKHGRKW